MRSQPTEFELPDPSEQIWRYCDLATFTAMLATKSLYFGRVDLLEDPYEGSYTRTIEIRRRQKLAAAKDDAERAVVRRQIDDQIALLKELRLCAFVNCWHIGAHDSMAMWRGYGGGPYGVAIQSTVERLDAVLPDRGAADSLSRIWIGRIKYLDYHSGVDAIFDGGLAHEYRAFMRKTMLILTSTSFVLFLSITTTLRWMRASS